jgi:hypothetical protein
MFLLSAAVFAVALGLLLGEGTECAPDSSAEPTLVFLLCAGLAVAGIGMLLAGRSLATGEHSRLWGATLLLNIALLAGWFLYYGGRCSA